MFTWPRTRHKKAEVHSLTGFAWLQATFIFRLQVNSRLLTDKRGYLLNMYLMVTVAEPFKLMLSLTVISYVRNGHRQGGIIVTVRTNDTSKQLITMDG